MLKSLNGSVQSIGPIGAPTGCPAFDVIRAQAVSVQCLVDVGTLGPGTFEDGTKQVQTIDYVADVTGSLNSKYYFIYSYSTVTETPKGFYVWFNINGAGVDPALVGYTGVEIAAGSNVTADDLVTATKTALDLLTDTFAACGASTSHLTINAKMPGAVIPAFDSAPAATTFTFNAPSPLGIDSAVSVLNSTITKISHGLVSGLKFQMSSTGTLPSPFTTATDYFVIVVNADVIQVAATQADAATGTFIPITDFGSNTDVVTLTFGEFADGIIRFQTSNDGTTWNDIGSSVTITGPGIYWLERLNPTGLWMRIFYSFSGGGLLAKNKLYLKGDMP